MKLIILLSICSGLALNACAQITRCVSPPLLVGSVAFTAKDGTLLSAGQYSYDALNEQIRFKDFGLNGDKHFSIDLLMQFQQGIVYEIDSTRSTCKKYPLKSSFHPWRIPTNAKFANEIYLGTSTLPQMSLQVTNWQGEDTEFHAKYFLTYTSFTCVPVSALIQTKELGAVTVGFYNQLLGIQDPMTFIPPSYCDSAPVEDLPPKDFFKALKLSS